MTDKKKNRKVNQKPTPATKDKRIPAPPRIATDLEIAEPVARQLAGLAMDRLLFDGYTLYWQGSSPSSYTGFSGTADESAKESVKDIGPVPQGKYAVNPANIELLVPSEDWGRHRVKLEPYSSTVDRMKDCFKVIRTGMYIHGGNVQGTHGCIEINDDSEEEAFFQKLKDYGKKIELEVRYVGEREKKYEDARCPYN
jgi:hypothetical protein